MGKIFIFGLLLSWMAPGAWAQGMAPPTGLEIQYDPETEILGITAPSLPLRDVLAAITEATGVVFILPPGMNPIVTRSVSPIPLERAIKQFLDLSSRNSAMIWVSASDSTERNRYLLTEVRVLEGGGSLGSGSVTPVSIVPAAPLKPKLTPEELAARRAEREVQKAAKDQAKAKRTARSGKSGRGGDIGASEPAAAPQVQGEPSAQAPPAPSTGTTVAPHGGGRRNR